MKLIKVISKTHKHKIKYKVKEDGKVVEKEKEVPNSYLFLELDSGAQVMISAVKAEDKRVLDSHAITKY